MKDRIIQFLSNNNLTSTKFADSIGVQRSSISHILSGRNKPSYDFIEKMLNAYPDLNAQWLITGKGNMYLNQASLFNEDKNENISDLTQRESNIQEKNEYITEKDKHSEERAIIEEKDLMHTSKSDVERIVFFYKNGSFKEYKPE